MEQHDLIQVLWVENDEKVTQTYPVKAKQQFGLQLVAFPYWEKAHEELKNNYDRWSAIILDAKCKFKSGSDDNAVEFLREALKDISVLAKERGRVIPWYVLTGGDANEVSYSINEERLMWDKDWTETHHRNFYSKATDREALYARIKKHYQDSHRLQIQKMYSNVFDAMQECKLDNQANEELIDLLIPIHFPKDTSNKDYNNRFKKARQLLEYIFQSMVDIGLLPPWGDEMNTRWSCCILSGKHATKGKNRSIVIQNNYPDDPALPIVMQKTMQSMVDILPADVHKKSCNVRKANIPDYLASVNGTSFLLKSFAFQLCDIILWYKNYLVDHNDIEQNKKRWDILDPVAMNMRI